MKECAEDGDNGKENMAVEKKFKVVSTDIFKAGKKDGDTSPHGDGSSSVFYVFEKHGPNSVLFKPTIVPKGIELKSSNCSVHTLHSVDAVG